ncbi:MAG: DUF3089 domain-containing protein [Cyclobacteriaceae bacterium]|nr:DUF3089 domain-containing protein [Cyclobacteriaceae bacterium]
MIRKISKAHLFIFISIIISSACSKGVYVIEKKFADSPIPSAPDYSKEEQWASLPGKADAADSVPLKSNLKNTQDQAKADVFFVFPTTFTEEPQNQYLWNADIGDKNINYKTQTTTILNQASIFNGSCRIYAPYYRQAHLYSFYAKDENDGNSALNLAYKDVQAAFEYYLKHYNNGRPIVIASHSQGSYHAMRLLRDYFDGKDLQKQLVVAYLAGRAIKPDEFRFIHPTEKPDEVAVWASWNTYARKFFPDNYEKYFRHSLSTNPLLWNSSSDFAAKELNHGGVGRHFTFVPNLVDAQNHEGVLWINKPYIPGRFLIRVRRWHIADMNFFYMNIRENVQLRIESFEKIK